MRKLVLLTLLALTLFSASAMAASLDGRFGFTGKGGVFVPLQSDFINGTSDSHSGLATGGGVIFGIKNFAVDVDVTYAPNFDIDLGGAKAYEATMTDISIGAQYRFPTEGPLVPYLGVGADFIKGHLKHISGNEYKLDWTEGGHANVGLDYFVTRGIAFNIDARGIFAAKGDLKLGSAKVGEYDPMSFVATFGVKLMLPQDAFW